MTEFTFELTNPITYQREGENLSGNELRLTAPSYKQRAYCQELKQLFYKAAKPQADKAAELKERRDGEARNHGPEAVMTLAAERKKKQDEKDENEKMSATDVVAFFLASELNMDHVTSIFEKLILSGVCKIDGIAINKGMLQDMSLSDFEKLFGEYMSHFLSIL